MPEESDDLIYNALVRDLNNIKHLFSNYVFEKSDVVRLCNTLVEESKESVDKMKTFRNRKRMQQFVEEVEYYRDYVDNTFEDDL